VTDTLDGSVGALVVRAQDEVVEVTGADRLTHLDATTSQALRDAVPGTASAALVLDANGNPLAMFDVLVLPDRVRLITPGPDVTAVVMDVIAGRTFLADARFALLDHRVVRVLPGAPDGAVELARRAWSGLAVVPDGGAVRTTPSGAVVLATDAAGVITLAGSASEVDELLARLVAAGAREVDAEEALAWQVAAGRPVWGREVVPPHLPEELGLLPTHVHLAKGCYPGQEAVARMWMLGRPRRRLARVRIGGPGSEHVSAGWSAGEGREAVRVTAAVPEQGGSAALAFVPGSAAVGDVVGDPTGPVVEVLGLVGDIVDPPGHDPAMRRRRDRDRSDAPRPQRLVPPR
jgi:tRNA-modifying protein YgfZ